jgi:hypothetical protein
VPTLPAAKIQFFNDLVEKCSASRDDRKDNYEKWRKWYLYGSDEVPGKFNKVYSHIDQLTSFMFSQETTKFSTNIDPSANDGNLAKVPVINQVILNEWHASNGDIVFGHALTWAFVYGSMFIKTRWASKQVEPYTVFPHDFGVLREDTPQLSRQEAFCNWYSISKSQLEYELDRAEHPRKKEILDNAYGAPKEDSGSMSARFIDVSTAVPSIGAVQGNVEMWPSNVVSYSPIVNDTMVEMCELYLWDDAISDYRIVTMAGNVDIYDRAIERMFLKGEHPFIQVCPTPAPDYFWGYSETERLVPLQILRNNRFDQIQHILDKQANPPKMVAGFPGTVDEIMLALDTPGGTIQSEMPGAKAEQMAPNVPEDLFREVAAIDAMFEEMSGITNVMQGRGESGVRSQGHASQLAKLGSSRAKKRALIVEDSLENMATLYLKIMQKYDGARTYRDEDGLEFVLDQFTDAATVKVDSHSNSPLFSDDASQKAFELFKAQAIDRDELLMLLDVPMEQLLRRNLKTKIIPEEQAKAKAEQEAVAKGEQAKHAHKGKR